MHQEALSDIERIFYSSPHAVCQKWMHYFRVYERYFAHLRGKRATFVEIGVSQGGSLDMWKAYFGPRVSIIGVDIDPACRRFEDDQVQIEIGDQGDPKFLAYLAEKVGEADAVLDDGGHRMDQQILTFEHLFPKVKEGGVFMCEDVHTSYDPTHGGGLGNSDTFIEYMKRKIDSMHEWYYGSPPQDSIARSADSICFHDSIVVVTKRAFSGPKYVEIGRVRR